jgi:hypothetical protein
MKMVSMNVKPDYSTCGPGEYNESSRLYLTAEQVEALGIKSTPAPGTVFSLQCKATTKEVTARAEDEKDEGPKISLTLCIDEMAATPATTDHASMLYGG